MKIHGFQTLTLLDYPGFTAATIFLGGCNFRCPFCQNAGLVLAPEGEPVISTDEVLGFLNKRKKVLDGVCITGGEPTLEPELTDLIFQIKELGYRVKLDTNGYEPDRLAKLIGGGLVDYIAMDIKSSPEGYSKASGIEGVELLKIERSIDLISSSGIEHEFRTTVVHELHTREDLAAIARRLTGEKRYFLQRFVDSGEILCEGMSAPTDDEMHDYLSAVREFIPTAELRGME